MSAYPQMPITSWAIEDRPREKLIAKGHGALTDAELLAILIGSGTRKMSAIDLARHLLDRFGGLENLARCSVPELTRVRGIGQAKAISIVAAFELARRKAQGSPRRIRVTQSETVAQYLTPRLADLSQEVFYILFLNRNNEVIGEKQLFQGGVASTIIDTRLVFYEAINRLASAIIVAHNHPSGNLRPSEADIAITRQLAEGGRIFNINLLDHLIITSRGWFSFNDEGMMS